MESVRPVSLVLMFMIKILSRNECRECAVNLAFFVTLCLDFFHHFTVVFDKPYSCRWRPENHCWTTFHHDTEHCRRRPTDESDAAPFRATCNHNYRPNASDRFCLSWKSKMQNRRPFIFGKILSKRSRRFCSLNQPILLGHRGMLFWLCDVAMSSLQNVLNCEVFLQYRYYNICCRLHLTMGLYREGKATVAILSQVSDFSVFWIW